MPQQLDLTGQRFGRLLVVGPAARIGSRTAWHCRCDCGGERDIRTASLRGITRSCGCLQREHARRLGKAARTHGGRHTPEYGVWCAMKARCANPRRSDYDRYGGRGVTVCARWRESFTAFIGDMGRRPSSLHSIDRVDPSGPYAPANCRWTTAKHQADNRRSIRWVTWRGERLPLKDACARAGLNYGTVRTRLELGWDIERALGQRAG